WTDRPLVTQDLVGGEDGIDDAGLSLSRLIVNPILFLEVTAEVYRGVSSDLFTAPERSDLTYVGRLRGYRDVSEATNIDVGGAFPREGLGGPPPPPGGGPRARAIHGRPGGGRGWVGSAGALPPGGAPPASASSAPPASQSPRRWFAGVRLDQSDRAKRESRLD